MRAFTITLGIVALLLVGPAFAPPAEAMLLCSQCFVYPPGTECYGTCNGLPYEGTCGEWWATCNGLTEPGEEEPKEAFLASLREQAHEAQEPVPER